MKDRYRLEDWFSLLAVGVCVGLFAWSFIAAWSREDADREAYRKFKEKAVPVYYYDRP